MTFMEDLMGEVSVACGNLFESIDDFTIVRDHTLRTVTNTPLGTMAVELSAILGATVVTIERTGGAVGIYGSLPAGHPITIDGVAYVLASEATSLDNDSLVVTLTTGLTGAVSPADVVTIPATESVTFENCLYQDLSDEMVTADFTGLRTMSAHFSQKNATITPVIGDVVTKASSGESLVIFAIPYEASGIWDVWMGPKSGRRRGG